MTDNQITQILTYLLIFMIFILLALVVVFIYVKMKDSKKKKDENKSADLIGGGSTATSTAGSTATRGYNKQSMAKFMEFDKIEDNMIVQKNGNRYLMVIECQGVNYDLMSAMEQTAVEEGFLEFLNSLRYPIQIYIQAPTE